MPQICSVCSHPKAQQIDIAIIRGEGSNRRIASQNRLTERAIRDHRRNHLSERLQRARQRDTEKRGIDLRAELFECFEHLRKLRAACNEYLTDPDDEEKYTLDPRAREVSVVYEEVERGADKSRRKRASLEALLHRLELKKGLGITVDRTEIRFADPRKLILDSLDRFDKHLRMLGDLTGEFKEPQVNPMDDRTRLNVAIETFRERMQDPKTGEMPTREEAIEWLAPYLPEVREVAEYVEANNQSHGAWTTPPRD